MGPDSREEGKIHEALPLSFRMHAEGMDVGRADQEQVARPGLHRLAVKPVNSLALFDPEEFVEIVSMGFLENSVGKDRLRECAKVIGREIEEGQNLHHLNVRKRQKRTRKHHAPLLSLVITRQAPSRFDFFKTNVLSLINWKTIND